METQLQSRKIFATFRGPADGATDRYASLFRNQRQPAWLISSAVTGKTSFNTHSPCTLRVGASMTRITIQSSLLPLLQAFLTGTSTALGVMLVVLWRPQRTRALPFYSDASHNDPERIILSSGENLACMLMPLVAIIEYLHHSRLLTFPHRQLHFRFLPSVSSSNLVRLNFFVTACTTIFFFITANVPSRFPATRLHQFAASALILFYALQATCKAILAYVFSNYRRVDTDPEKGDTTLQSTPRHFSKIKLFWDRHHMKLRVLLASALWSVLIGTWICFTGRVITQGWGSGYQALRNGFSVCMAAMVHVATLSCVALMGIMAVDMRDERLVLSTKGD